MMKYYFLTYQAKHHTDGHTQTWNEVTNLSPMQFIKETSEAEGDGKYYDFVVINTCEISKEDYELFKDEF